MASLDTQVFLTPKQLVGDIVPTIYIDRIVLDGGGHLLKETNPHIDWEGEGVRPGGINPGISTNIDAALAREKETADNLSVTLNLSIKDVASNRTYSWFKDAGIDIREYITINIIQTTTLAATTRWSEFYNLSTLPVSTPPPGRVDAETQDATELAERAFYGTSGVSFPLSDLMGPPPSAVDIPIHYVEIDSNGNRIINITKEIMFPKGNWTSMAKGGNPRNLPKNPDHLAYFTYAFFDLKKLIEDFELEQDWTPSTNIINTIGKVSSDIVIKDGKVVTGAYVFVTLDNDLWTGDIHYLNNSKQWFGGKEHIPGENQPELIRRLVQNSKVQDFRLTEKIEKLNLDFAILEKKLLRQISGNSRVNTDIVKRKSSYFTDIQLSRNKEGDCQFFFGIDFQKVIRENSPYGKIFLENVKISEVLKKTKILSMDIYRVRIDGSPEAGSRPHRPAPAPNFDPVKKPKRFNYDSIANNGVNYTRIFGVSNNPNTSVDMRTVDQTDELILSARETPNGDFKFFAFDGVSQISTMPQIWTKGLIKTVRLGVKSFDTWKPSEEVAVEYYNGLDVSMRNLTDGFYQYRVELEIEDASVEFLVEQRKKLSDAKKLLEEYYQEGSKLGITGISRKIAKRETMEEDILISGKAQEANFDPIANRFTQNFINWASEFYSEDETPWETVPDIYIDMLGIFVDLPEKEDIKTILMNYANPISGNLKGVMTLLNLIDQLTSIIERGIGTTRGRPHTKTASGASPSVAESDIGKQRAPTIKKFKIGHHFSAIFNANIPKNIGISYLDSTPPEFEQAFGGGDPRLGGAATDVGGRLAEQEQLRRANAALAGATATGGGALSGIGRAGGLTEVSSERFKGLVRKQKKMWFANENASGDVGGHTVNANDSAFSYYSPSEFHTPSVNASLVAKDPNQPPPLISDSNFIKAGVDAVLAANGQYGLSSTETPRGRNLKERLEQLKASSGGGGRTLASAFPAAGSIRNFFSGFLNASPSAPGVPPAEPPVILPGNAPEIDEGCSVPSVEQLDQLHDEDFTATIAAVSIFMPIMTSDPNSDDHHQASPVPVRRTVADFNPSNPQGVFKNIDFTPAFAQSLPNPLKALCMTAGGGSNITSVPSTSISLNPDVAAYLQSNPFDADTKFKTDILFNIAALEVLSGYRGVNYGKKDGTGEDLYERSVKMPVWELLTEDIFNAASNRFLLCRFKKVDNPVVSSNSGISRLPLYEQHFLIKGGSVADAGSVAARFLPDSAKEATQMYSSTASPRGPLSVKLNNPAYQTSNSYAGNRAAVAGTPTNIGTGAEARTGGGTSGGGTSGMGGGGGGY